MSAGLDAFVITRTFSAVITAMTHRAPSAPIRVFAWFAVALVMALAVLAVTPAAHAALHGYDEVTDHSCAVTLFAQGVTAAVGASILAVVTLRFLCTAFVWRKAVVQEPEYFHLPACGPPAV